MTPAEMLGARRIMVPANGLEFEVFEAGQGDQLAMLLHGFPEHAIQWRHLVGPLVAAGYRVWAVNQRGYGDSSRPREKSAYSLNALTGDIAGLIDAAGAKSTTLIAHDWGGFIAWVAVVRRLRSIDRFVAINIPHPMCFRRELKAGEQKRRSWYVAVFQLPLLADWLMSFNRGWLIGRLLRGAVHRTNPIPEEALEIYRNNVAAPGAATAMLNYYRVAAPDLFRAKDLSEPIETPTLMIWGTRDVALAESCLDGTERYVKHLQIERLPGVTHFSPEDAPEKVASLVTRFLNSGKSRDQDDLDG